MQNKNKTAGNAADDNRSADPASAKAPKRRDRRRTDTRERILKSAEFLFAHYGYDRVSIRDITQHAAVNLALVTYHFGTKEGLLESALERRADVLNRERREALDRVMAGPAPTIAGVIRAFVEPYLRYGTGRDQGWRNYCQLISMVAASGRWPELLARLFDPNANRFIDALTTVEPAFDRVNAARAFLLCVATMMTSLRAKSRLVRLIGSSAADDSKFIDEEVAFIAGGIVSLATLARSRLGDRSPG